MAGRTPPLLVRTVEGELSPARAGKTRRRASHSANRPGSSPRVRGARAAQGRGEQLIGLIPARVRRAHLLQRRVRGMGGLIPARAGSTLPGGGAGSRRRAHPRACGEHPVICSRPVMSQGSSPRVRGAQFRWCRQSSRGGLIPARAGSTPTGICGVRIWRAHPRACGEHTNQVQDNLVAAGSSPRVRGALFFGDPSGGFPGLIPARAGSTLHDQRVLSR